MSKGVKSVARFVGDTLTGGAISAREARKEVNREAARQEAEMAEMEATQQKRRRNQLITQLQGSPSLFDVLGQGDGL